MEAAAVGTSGRGYVTFLDTARAEGERSTPWSPATGLNFKRTKQGRGKQRKTKEEEGKEERNLEVERDRERVK